jgi:hypothetical protein
MKKDHLETYDEVSFITDQNFNGEALVVIILKKIIVDEQE